MDSYLICIIIIIIIIISSSSSRLCSSSIIVITIFISIVVVSLTLSIWRGSFIKISLKPVLDAGQQFKVFYYVCE